MLKERKVKINSVDINFSEGPKTGSPLLLLHGLPGCWQEFLPILPNLILLQHVYALDFRGQGKSGRVPGRYQSKFYIEDVLDFIKRQLSEPVILYGNSAGGLVALGVAAQSPAMVKAVILGDTPIDMKILVNWMKSDGFIYYFRSLQEISTFEDISIQEIADKIANIPIGIPGKDEQIRYGDSPGVDPIQIQHLAMTLKQMDSGVLDYHATGRVEDFLEGFELDKILEQIQCPVLLIQGNASLGGMMTNDAIKHVEAIVSNVEHAYIESAGHDLGLESWSVAPLLRVLISFLNVLETESIE